MTRRKAKQNHWRDSQFRSERISKLLDAGWIESSGEIPHDAIPVDPDQINLGGSYFRPIYYQNIEFTCKDCGVEEVWKAEDQAWYFETSGAPYYQIPVRCRPCRKQKSLEKAEARKRSGHD